MAKGFIIKTVDLPTGCYECEEVEEYGYCPNVGMYVDRKDIKGRYPTCPIVTYEEALKELEEENNCT